MRLYIVSTCLCKNLVTNMFNVTHENDFVTQKVSRYRSFSVWTRAWTRLVVDTLRGNMSVEPKHRKLWDKLYTCDDFAWPSHVLPTDRQTPPAGRVAPIPRLNTRRSASAPRVAPPRAPDLWKAINDDAVIRRWQLQRGSFCSYRDCYLMGQSRTLGIFGVAQLTQNFS